MKTDVLLTPNNHKFLFIVTFQNLYSFYYLCMFWGTGAFLRYIYLYNLIFMPLNYSAIYIYIFICQQEDLNI